jgi:ATP-dependent DNA helicase RecG
MAKDETPRVSAEDFRLYLARRAADFVVRGQDHPRQMRLDFDEEPLGLLSVRDIYDRADESLLRRLKEDCRIERKPPTYHGAGLAQYLSMWANTPPDGGLIVLGQRDSKAGGTFEGCKGVDPDTLNKIELTGANLCPDAKLLPPKRIPVTNENGERDFVLLLRVEYNPEIVVKTNAGEAFHRVGSDKRKLSPEEVRELAADKGEINFEQRPVSLKYPDDFDANAVAAWARNVRTMMDSGHDLSDAEILENRHLGRIRGGTFEPNVACAPVFAHDPRQIIPGCKIRFLRYDGETEGTGEKYNAVKDVWIEGNIPTMIARAEQVISAQLRTFSPLREDGKFFPLPEYPQLAWYEAVVNACVHRSYGNGMKNMDVFVRMFDDRLEIESPGPFMPFVTPENIYQTHTPRNPKTMEALFFLQLVKMNREGTRRMRDTMSQIGLPAPLFEQKQINHALVRVTLRNDIKKRRVWIDQDVTRLVSKAIAADLTEEQKRVLNWVAEFKRISVSDAVKLLNVSWDTARRVLLDLASRRVLQWVRFEAEGTRDPKAFFRLRSGDPFPEGAFEGNPGAA